MSAKKTSVTERLGRFVTCYSKDFGDQLLDDQFVVVGGAIATTIGPGDGKKQVVILHDATGDIAVLTRLAETDDRQPLIVAGKYRNGMVDGVARWTLDEAELLGPDDFGHGVARAQQGIDFDALPELATPNPHLRRRLLEERWKVLMTRPVRFKDDYDISSTNSRRFQRIDDTLDELAAMLVDEVNGTEVDSLTTVTEGIWKVIHERLIAWAEQIEADRDARKVAAA